MEIKQLCASDIHPGMLAGFNRYQEVSQCWRKDGGIWRIQDVSYTSQWDDAKKEEIIDTFSLCLKDGGCVAAAFDKGVIVGFALIDARLFGSQNQYADMGYLHVSKEYRNMGVGKKLFFETCHWARMIGASKLYISAHSAVDSVSFYMGLGCTDAVEINEKHALSEPFDRQMEYDLLG